MLLAIVDSFPRVRSKIEPTTVYHINQPKGNSRTTPFSFFSFFLDRALRYHASLARHVPLAHLNSIE